MMDGAPLVWDQAKETWHFTKSIDLKGFEQVAEVLKDNQIVKELKIEVKKLIIKIINKAKSIKKKKKINAASVLKLAKALEVNQSLTNLQLAVRKFCVHPLVSPKVLTNAQRPSYRRSRC